MIYLDTSVVLARLFAEYCRRSIPSGRRPAEQALDAIQAGIATMKTSPFTCRKAGQSPFLRELVISFGHSGSGYVALFEMWTPPTSSSRQCAFNSKTITTDVCVCLSAAASAPAR